jgi:hypothetical protein
VLTPKQTVARIASDDPFLGRVRPMLETVDAFTLFRLFGSATRASRVDLTL